MQNKPFIGITCAEDIAQGRNFLAFAYTEAIKQSGGIPVLLPTLNKTAYPYLLNRIDGLLLSGGSDLDPQIFGEEPQPNLGEITPDRDFFEIALTEAALNLKLPILAICRGIQVLNVAAGGKVMQDIFSEVEAPIKHSQNAPRWHPTHSVEIVSHSLLNKIFGVTHIKVNSFHHQAVGKIAEGFRVTGRSADGVVEAIEGIEHPFAVGVQWHPEGMYNKDRGTQQLFRAFIAACKKTDG